MPFDLGLDKISVAPKFDIDFLSNIYHDKKSIISDKSSVEYDQITLRH